MRYGFHCGVFDNACTEGCLGIAVSVYVGCPFGESMSRNVSRIALSLYLMMIVTTGLLRWETPKLCPGKILWLLTLPSTMLIVHTAISLYTYLNAPGLSKPKRSGQILSLKS